MDENQVVPVMVRMPRRLKEELQQIAKENERTVNGEIVFRIKESLEKDRDPQDDHA